MKKDNFWQKAGDFFNGKGFYMVLAMCLCAIILSGWYLVDAMTTSSRSQTASGEASVTVTGREVAAQPEDEDDPPAQEQDVTPEQTEQSQQTLQPVTPEDTKQEDKPADSNGGEKSTQKQAEQTTQQTRSDKTEPSSEKEPVETPVDKVDNLHQTMQYPVPGAVVAAFSADTLTYNEAMGDWRTHNGIDLTAEEGDEVVAAWAGKVTSVREDPMLGTMVVMDCGDGYTTTYANLASSVGLHAGDKLKAGELVGTVGRTAAGEVHGDGTFLHFAVTKDGKEIDPAKFLKQK